MKVVIECSICDGEVIFINNDETPKTSMYYCTKCEAKDYRETIVLMYKIDLKRRTDEY